MDIQNITITSTQIVPQPKPHTTYTIQISTPTRTWTVNRRYNDFLAFHDELKSSTGKEPPAQLPAKHTWSLTRSVYDDKIVRERRILLEQYLRTLLTTKDPRWRQSYGFSDFLAVPTPRASSSTEPTSSSNLSSNLPPPPDIFTATNWLSEQSQVQSLLRLVRAALLKRDALALQLSDASGSRSAGVQAKRLLKEVSVRLSNLEKGLISLSGLGEGENRRREELIEGLKAERDNLNRMSETGIRTSGSNFSSSAGISSGGKDTMPGGIGSIWNTNPQPGRVFGIKNKPQETEETRPLDERGLVQLQQHRMDDQDQQLGELSKVLQRQRKMGEEIHQEIEEQNEMLDHVEGEVTRVGGKLARAKRQMNQLK
ncbi:hypothetical protein TREMEDRAFT_37265 [Tremella mesenterica DSM 1558]|uniref:uncharacterized protein n=1 Tax=Tremella mesenterica (strain ATCC 24925 / CBS 8224 / DSM 1558 / NBRC 9311 / NRRL Y-6157 / RJB 2259-6 / UBC 559-6) TaxID=578456 RepID=UPI0003F4947F|nr:uncharacterized protein TREMEDRAFT_37265 [Tremella mesenterica DSM 1558]EIW73286.1 hypothetical protein TREMEDRAFT_37265 [Tremella mesenterica DSM 1558]